MPLDLAMREAYFKGSFLNRMSSLEYRLFSGKERFFPLSKNEKRNISVWWDKKEKQLFEI